MAVTHIKKGCIDAIQYWKNEKGNIMLMPTNDVLTMDRLRRYMGKMGYMLHVADTLRQAEQLQNDLQAQLKREQEMELAKDENMTHIRRQQVRDRLYARSISSNTSQYEREFIQQWLEWRNHKHDLFRKKFNQEVGHLDALEFDNPNKHLHDILDRG